MPTSTHNSVMFQELLTWLQSLAIWQIAFLLFTLGLAIEIGQGIFAGIYNVFFHPLRHIPGNQWDIAIPLRTYLRVFRGQSAHTVKARHKKYGDVIRTGANLLSFTSPEAWKDIYGSSVDLPKSIVPGAFPADSISIANKADHMRQRKIMIPSFSDKSLIGQEQLMRGYIDLLVKRLRETNGQITEAVMWYNLTTFDLIGDLTFGQSLEGLESMETNLWIKTINKQMQIIPFMIMMKVSKVVGFLIKMILGPRMLATKAKARANVKAMVEQRMKQPDRGDFMDHLIGRLPDHELVGNADVLMLAGSHTSSVLLSGLTYFLCKNPDPHAKLKKEIREAFEDGNQITFKSCAKLPYLLAVVEEALRIFPPIPVALPRKTVAPIKICGIDVPANTSVGIPHLGAYHNTRNFHRAEEFIPERWIEKDNPDSAFYKDKREVFAPFSHGPRNCIGQTLAYHEIRLIIAKVIWNFDIILEPECRDWGNQRIFATWELPPLKVRYIDRLRNEK